MRQPTFSPGSAGRKRPRSCRGCGSAPHSTYGMHSE